MQTFVPWSSSRDAGSMSSLLYIISSCTRDLLSSLEVLQEQGMKSAVEGAVLQHHLNVTVS